MNKKIVLVVGASGVGKDTLLNELKKILDANFIKRYITRIPDINETNYYLSKEAFIILKQNSFFISSWSAHGNFYGISKNCIKDDSINIISISRAVIQEFEKEFENVFTINIVLDKDTLKKRLIKRNRETLTQIENRLNRTYTKIEAKNLLKFCNDKSINESAKKLKELIISLK